MTALVQPVSPQLRQAFLDCHAEGHQWRPNGRIDAIEAEPGLRPPFQQTDARGRRSLCVSCAGERVRWYTRSGEVVNRYKMQPGYYHQRATPDDLAPSRQWWRQQLVISLFEDAPKAATPRVATRKGRRAS